jgi:hypothetical protein
MATEGTGAVAARDLGQGWKVSPSIHIAGPRTVTLADIDGPGAIQQIWITVAPTALAPAGPAHLLGRRGDPVGRDALGDFFCMRLGHARATSTRCRWREPGGRLQLLLGDALPPPRCRITIENHRRRGARLLLPDRLHADRGARGPRLPPRPVAAQQPAALWEVHTLLDGVKGQRSLRGHLPGLGRQQARLVGRRRDQVLHGRRREWPTICGTGTEDYFGGAWNFEHPKGEYGVFSTPFLGLPQVIKPDGLYRSQQRFGMYRWHIMDPIRFQQDLRVTIQALGWRRRWRAPATCRSGRHRLHRLLVPDRTPRPLPERIAKRCCRGRNIEIRVGNLIHNRA